MIKIEHLKSFGFEAAFRGMRNPMNSWNRSDSKFDEAGNLVELGENDENLCLQLIKGGPVHRKFLRQIFISLDITAPLYWWKEFDTYKVGTVADSCSTMHKIHAQEFTLEDFSIEHLNEDVIDRPLRDVIACLNFFREAYLLNKDKDDWWQMIQLLPSSYNQKRTVTMSYENFLNMYKYRKDHKLDEWRDFCSTLNENLPLMKKFTGL